jgi:uncharacterized protein YceH (UPF0502 family)
LFGGPIESAPLSLPAAASPDALAPRPNALAALEARVEKLEQELAALKQALGRQSKQHEGTDLAVPSV